MITNLTYELVIAGAGLGLLLGLSGIGRIVGRAAAGILALVAIWVLLREGPYALVDHFESLVEAARGYIDLLLGLVGGLLVAGAIERERNRPERG